MTKVSKKGGGKKKKKGAPSRYKDPSKMCCDPFPMFAYDVKDVNKTNKSILLTIICILWCFSVVIACIGAYLIIQRKDQEEVISAGNFSEFWLNFSLVLLCNGIVSSVITYCGLVGVLRENIALVRVFYIALIAALLLKLGLAVFVFVFADYSRPFLERMLAEQAVVDYRSSSDVETLMDYLQTTFHCCGLRDDGFQDWTRNIYFNCSDGNPSPERCGVPWSCCRNQTGVTNALCGRGVQRLDRNIASRAIHTMGCLHAVQLWVYSHAVVAGLVALLEVAALVAVTFQCTRLVNELQMLNGVYRGPWWDRKAAPHRRRAASPASREPPPSSPRPAAAPPGQTERPPPPPADDETHTKLPSVVKMGHGPAVRRTKTAPPGAKARHAEPDWPADGEAGQPDSEEAHRPAEDEDGQPLDETSQRADEEADLTPGEGSGRRSSEPPAIVVVGSGGQ
ncbi:tetraspanin-33-like [Amphibalanus amphitrite]|uniref:tetraspanin-33-like n=1 Tax=Amphibalanus amphitrite TaxID=1232801 RepID=UPI001C9145A1|nr:tetraspanin-33-like [Amphibalanus amphitrite]